MSHLLATLNKMTLLGAVLTSEGILVASDSSSLNLGVEENTTVASDESATKLWQIGTESLVWGFAGEGATGQPFGEWLANEPLTGWPALAASAGAKLSEINIEANRKVAAYAQVVRKPAQSVASHVLIAGFIGGIPDIIRINAEGMPSRRGSLREVFVGSGAVQATIGLARCD